MPICPECGKEIYHLREFSLVWAEYTIEIDEYGNPRYEFVDTSESIEKKHEYQCPECGEVLFIDAKKAIEFLNENKE
ncbi:MAG: hypothetical protein DRJ45_05535 [Thermoprotei archaeon]|nr:MAG: hypothetical protein DRJ45_05535 [Thermoprotei archaeon]